MHIATAERKRCTKSPLRQGHGRPWTSWWMSLLEASPSQARNSTDSLRTGRSHSPSSLDSDWGESPIRPMAVGQ